MKKIGQIILGISLGISLFFNQIKEIKAETVIAQQTISTSKLDSGANGGRNSLMQKLDQPSGTYNSLNVALSPTSSPGVDQISTRIYACNGNSDIPPIFGGSDANCTIENSSATTTLGIVGDTALTKRFYQFSFPSTALNPTKYYWITVFSSNGVSGWGSTNPNSYSPGYYIFNDAIQNTTTYDMYFLLGTDINPITTEGNSISIAFPTEGLVTPAFQYWLIDYTVSLFYPIENIGIEIKWGTSTSHMTRRDGGGITQSSASNTPFLVDYFFEISDYFAQAFIKNGTSTLATSTLRTFSVTSIGDPFNTQPQNPFGYSTTTGEIFTQCEQNLGSGNSFLNFWGNGFCNAMKFLFQPHVSVLTALKNTLLSFKEVFPFNIFFGLTNKLTDELINAPAGQISTFTVNKGPLNFSANIFTPTALEDTLGQPSTGAWFALQRYLLYAGLGFMVYRKIT